MRLALQTQRMTILPREPTLCSYTASQTSSALRFLRVRLSSQHCPGNMPRMNSCAAVCAAGKNSQATPVYREEPHKKGGAAILCSCWTSPAWQHMLVQCTALERQGKEAQTAVSAVQCLLEFQRMSGGLEPVLAAQRCTVTAVLLLLCVAGAAACALRAA